MWAISLAVGFLRFFILYTRMKICCSTIQMYYVLISLIRRGYMRGGGGEGVRRGLVAPRGPSLQILETNKEELSTISKQCSESFL
jgi:hypothetical protein